VETNQSFVKTEDVNSVLQTYLLESVMEDSLSWWAIRILVVESAGKLYLFRNTL
jgi:hypothetical protein